MKLTTLQVSLRARMHSIASCKAGTFEELDDNSRIELTKEEINQLDCMVDDEFRLGSPTSDFTYSSPAPSMIFVLKRDNKMYLVNTEGFDYCRYIARIRTITTVGV